MPTGIADDVRNEIEEARDDLASSPPCWRGSTA